MEYLPLVVVWLFGAGLGASAFSKKGESAFAGFFLSLFASPLLTLLYAAALPETAEEAVLRDAVRQILREKNRPAAEAWTKRMSPRDALTFAIGLDTHDSKLEDAARSILRDSENAQRLAQAEGRLCPKCGLVRNPGFAMCPQCLS